MAVSLVMVKRQLKRSAMKMSSRKNGSLLPHDDDSDSDVIQEFSLPKKRVIKPGKSSYTARRRWSCCRTCASILLSLILIASIMCVVVLGWFSLRLKRDLDSMKKRVIKVESFDRSTSREYAELQKNLDGQIVKLQHNQDGVAALDKQHFLSVVKQLAFLNRTVDYLNEKVKSPQSAAKINQDIELLKNGMADINQEITQVKDQVAQLKKLALVQNSNIVDLKDKLWNLTVQVVHLTGKPMPVPPKVTSTPPLILRVPVQSDISGKEQSTSEIFKNLTAKFALEIGHVRGYITSINNSFASRIDHLETKMDGLVKNIRNHMVQVDELAKEVDSFKTLESMNNNKTHDGHFPVKIEKNKQTTETRNFSVVLTRMVQDIHAHGQELSLLMSRMTLMNHSIHSQEDSPSNGEGKQTAVACNCSGVFQEVKKMLDADEKKLDSVRAELDQLKQTAVKGHESQSATTLPPTTAEYSTGSTASSESVAHATKNASDTMKVHKKAELEENELEGEIPTSSVHTEITTKGLVDRATGGGSTEAVPQNSTENAEVNEKSIREQQNTTVTPVIGADSTEPPPTAASTASAAEKDETSLELS